VRLHAAKPLGLGENGFSRLLASHRRLYTIRPVDGYDFVHREVVRFNDLDGMDHVNNAIYATYMESARLAYLESLGAGRNPQKSLILARLEIDFRSPISFGEEVEIGVRVSRVGSKSFDLEHEVRADGRLAAQGKSVLVAYDYTTNSSRELPPEWRELLEGVPV
jgi:acyl-CoA thioester hydrolase